jgi:hypothetical protein
MNERTIDEEQVREEHLAAVSVGAHWAYLLGVLAGGTGLMLVFIAWLAS